MTTRPASFAMWLNSLTLIFSANLFATSRKSKEVSPSSRRSGLCLMCVSLWCIHRQEAAVPRPFARLVLILVALNVAWLLQSCQRATEAPSPATPDLPVAEGRRLDPVDEAPLDPSFLKVREDLLRAVDRRDAAYVVSVLDPSIK